ncbi:MAG: hypothetical protein H7Z73_04330 [Candidatus Saccharibacteria bacterium]|nr:hypothetical protein [Moraxellaceae bacterium]
MDGGSIKVFRPSLTGRFASVLMIMPFLLFTHSIITNDPTIKGASRLFLGLIVLIFLIVALFFGTQKITIADQKVVSSNIFRKKIFPLSLIKRCKKEDKIKGKNFVIVDSGDLIIWIGLLFTENQLIELEAYILEQIKEFYPENYDAVKSDRFGIEEFWRK